MISNEVQNGSKSGLPSPIMMLTGHKGPIYSARFHPEGRLVASGGHDKNILIWAVYEKCRNVATLKGHKNAILQLQWAKNGEQLYSCGADNLAAVWDVISFQRIKKVKGHESVVNSICPAPKCAPLFVTASNDRTAKLWDVRKRTAIMTISHDTAVTAAALSSTNVVTAGVDEQIRVFERRKPGVLRVLVGHKDLVSSLSYNAEENRLLSLSFDNTARIWDMSPYSSQSSRFVKGFSLPVKGLESILLRANWSADGSKITAGSSDHSAYIFDAEAVGGNLPPSPAAGHILYRLPGHSGAVTEVELSPTEGIVLSCGADGKLFLGEI